MEIYLSAHCIVQRAMSVMEFREHLYMGLPADGIWITRHGKTAGKFYLLHKYHAMYSGGVTGFTEFLGSMVRPSISHLNCFCVRLLTSLSVRSHTNFPCSRRLYSRRKPSPSHTIPFMRSAFLPQNKRYKFIYTGA
mgnify:CR=1 FL=1